MNSANQTIVLQLWIWKNLSSWAADPWKQRQIVCYCWATFQVSPKKTFPSRRNTKRQVLYFFHRSDNRYYLIGKTTVSLKKIVQYFSPYSRAFFITWTPTSILALSSVFHVIKIIAEKQICYLKLSFLSFLKVLKTIGSYFRFHRTEFSS